MFLNDGRAFKSNSVKCIKVSLPFIFPLSELGNPLVKTFSTTQNQQVELLTEAVSVCRT